jgi:peptidoglycan/xylan/chitin deacetylase (PgdA/CDA1 family)
MKHINNDKGSFVISLDFELLWGVWDVTTKDKYGNHIKGVKEVIPKLLELFSSYDFKVTFATVGFLFAQNKEELLNYLPLNKPSYSNENYNVYNREMHLIGENESDDPFHFGYSLFELIRQSPHEMASHTFSHYFCLEEGQSAEEFHTDIKTAQQIAKAKNLKLKSFVFPRNQLNPEYLAILKNNGIDVYRGNPTSWIYKPRKFTAEVLFIRLCRLLDTYFPISGYNTHSINSIPDLPVNIPASRFLKPYNKNLAWLESLKLARIKKEMTRAAEKGELYHLWWHPHNFGVNLEENMANLDDLLKHFTYLQDKYGFTNLTMEEAASLAKTN